MDIPAIHSECEKVVRRIGARMQQVRATGGPSGVMTKGKADYVTEVDTWAEGVIAEMIAERFPEHLLIGEETSAELQQRTGKSLRELGSSGICWVVDPIDGTANFVSGMPLSVVSIGVLSDGDLRFGMVYDPGHDELFHAVAGQGAFLNGSPIAASDRTDLAAATVSSGFPHDRVENLERYRYAHEALLRHAGKVRQLGATALELCWVACGRLDAFHEYHPKPWDVAAGSIIASEAGAELACVVSPPEQPYSVFSDSVLAANPDLMKILLPLAREAEGKAVDSGVIAP